MTILRQLFQKRDCASDPIKALVFRWADGKRRDCALCQLGTPCVGDQCVGISIVSHCAFKISNALKE
jgi:hypothetical protein